MHKNVKAIVMAAGKGTRMRSDKAKVLHDVDGTPMLQHVLSALDPLGMEDIVVVIGHQAEAVERSVESLQVRFARQDEQLGTAHAVLAAEREIGDFDGTVLILCGDTPLIRSRTLEDMLRDHERSRAGLTVMTTLMDEPGSYGRVITDSEGNLLKIVEAKDASPEEKAVREINAGVYCVDGRFLFKGLKEVGSDNRQKEFYLTDLVEIAIGLGLVVRRHICADPNEVLGVNSVEELKDAEQELKKRHAPGGQTA